MPIPGPEQPDLPALPHRRNRIRREPIWSPCPIRVPKTACGAAPRLWQEGSEKRKKDFLSGHTQFFDKDSNLLKS